MYVCICYKCLLYICYIFILYMCYIYAIFYIYTCYIYILCIYMLYIHNARRRHLSELKASEVYSFLKIYDENKTRQLKPGKGAAIW